MRFLVRLCFGDGFLIGGGLVVDVSVPPQEILPNKAKGEALAKEFTDQQGRKILLVVGGFQGKKTVADFTLPPDSKVVSHFGNTRRLRDGTWRFQGKGILYDLLEFTGN